MNSEENLTYSKDTYDLALDSTGTHEQALSVIKKELQDAHLIKVYIDLAGKNGFLFFLISDTSHKVLKMFSVMGSSSALRKINPFETFEHFILDIEKPSDREVLKIHSPKGLVELCIDPYLRKRY